MLKINKESAIIETIWTVITILAIVLAFFVGVTTQRKTTQVKLDQAYTECLASRAVLSAQREMQCIKQQELTNTEFMCMDQYCWLEHRQSASTINDAARL